MQPVPVVVVDDIRAREGSHFAGVTAGLLVGFALASVLNSIQRRRAQQIGAAFLMGRGGKCPDLECVVCNPAEPAGPDPDDAPTDPENADGGDQ